MRRAACHACSVPVLTLAGAAYSASVVAEAPDAGLHPWPR
jgi:hypothetical protein